MAKNLAEITYEEIIEQYKNDVPKLVYEVRRKARLEGYTDGYNLGKIAGISRGMEIIIGQEGGA